MTDETKTHWEGCWEADTHGECARIHARAAVNHTHKLQEDLADAISAKERAEAWTEEDQPLPEDDAIMAQHPINSCNHAQYAEALRLVGAKRSKYALVDLVNWLLAKRDALAAKLAEAERDAERYRFIRDADRSDCITRELGLYAMETLDEYVDAAMEDESAIDAARGVKS